MSLTSAWSRRVVWGLLFTAGFLALAAMTAPRASAAGDDPADEILFYREDGLYRYYDTFEDGRIGSPLSGGSGYTANWDSIVAVDLDGQGQDELLFYRADGLYRYYEVKPDGRLGVVLNGGSGYTAGWDSIVALDLDGDGQDELFFYRDDGLYRYYDVRSNGTLGAVLNGGTGYTGGWDEIVGVDLDGDGRDEMLFYRNDGLYRYYDVRSNGTLSRVLSGGTGYTSGWGPIVAIDLDGDRADEMLFYRSDGLYRYYEMRVDGGLASVVRGGTGYTPGWSSITALNLQGDLPIERISRFTTFFDCCQPRVTNIRQIAREVNGTVVQPGETFSIDAVTGPRTSAGGYVPAPYLLEGEGQCCAVGGGVSQFGTTMFNAVFWGGLDDVEHRPHSGWISRYPLGIEATLVYSAIDVKFRNDTATPITVRTSSTSTSVTVELWGNQGGWQVTGWHARGARNPSVAVLDHGGSQAKRVSGWVVGSAPGQVTIVRRLVQGGNTTTETWFWFYVS